jgi:hypothetical protein
MMRSTADRYATKRNFSGFLAFWQHHGRPWPIRAAHVLDWLAAESHPQHPYRGQHRFYTLRAFLQQVRIFEPETEVPEKIFKFRRPRRTPHLFSEREIVLLMRATRRLRLVRDFSSADSPHHDWAVGEHRSAHWGSPQTQNRGSQVNGQSALSDDLRNEIWKIAKCCSACHDGAPFEKISHQKRKSLREPNRRVLLHNYLRQAAWVRFDPLDISEVAPARRNSICSRAAGSFASFL